MGATNPIPDGVTPSGRERVSRVDDRLGDVKTRTGQLTERVNDMPRARRYPVTDQFDRLDTRACGYLGTTGVENPDLEATDLFENTGPRGRRALNDLAKGRQDDADILPEMDDAAIQYW